MTPDEAASDSIMEQSSSLKVGLLLGLTASMTAMILWSWSLTGTARMDCVS